MSDIKISMLMPARGRPKNLEQSVASVFDLAAKPDEVEVIVRLDRCDPVLPVEMEVLKRFSGEVHVGVGDRLGYANMHHYYDWTAKAARGKWLFLWNDDIEMRTKNWDELVHEAPDFSIQWLRRDITETSDFTLPIVGRPIFEAMGHISQNAFCDAWLADISAFAGTSVVRDDLVFVHHRLNDDTMAGQSDGGKEWAKFSQEEQRAMRLADRDAVVAAPGWGARYDGWNTEAVHPQLDYLNLDAPAKPTAYILRGRK